MKLKSESQVQVSKVCRTSNVDTVESVHSTDSFPLEDTI